MASLGCVTGWVEDKGVKGATNLKPVLCTTVIAVMSTIIAKRAGGEELNEHEARIEADLLEQYNEAAL